MKKAKGKQTVTLKDIAVRTGYSVNTVSRALRGKDDIAPETREKISMIAKEMGHVRNVLAMSLRVGYTSTIAVILGDVSNPHFAIMMKEIEGHARDYGYTSFLINTNEDEELEMAAIESALNRSVDGIIICPTQKSRAGIEYLKKTGIPFVLIGRRYTDIDTDYVICNDELGGYQATKALLEHGHQKILMLHGPQYISSARERLDGYRRAYGEYGMTVDEGLVCEVPVTSHDNRDRQWQEIVCGKQFTAVFAFSDFLAWEVWDCLLRQGKRVPEDCSLIGFDYIQSRLPLPFRLTSVSSHKGRMSTTAVELLVKRIREEEEGGVRQVVIDTSLADGDTVSELRAE